MLKSRTRNAEPCLKMAVLTPFLLFYWDHCLLNLCNGRRSGALITRVRCPFFRLKVLRSPICPGINLRDLPVATEHIKQNDDEAQAVTGQEGATKEPGQSAGTMLPPGHLMNNKKGG